MQIGNTEIDNSALLVMILAIIVIVILTGFAIYCGGATCLYR